MLQRNPYVQVPIKRDQKSNFTHPESFPYPKRIDNYLCLYYMQEMSTTKIANICNIAQQNVEKAIKKYDIDAYYMERENRQHKNTDGYLCCFYMLGLSVAKIAKEFNVTRQAVEKSIHKYDPEAYKTEKENRKEQNKFIRKKKLVIAKKTRRRMRKAGTSQNLITQVKKYAENGYTRYEIAEKLCISVAEVMEIYKAAITTWPERKTRLCKEDQEKFTLCVNGLRSLNMCNEELSYYETKQYNARKELEKVRSEYIYMENAHKLRKVGKLRVSEIEYLSIDVHYTKWQNQVYQLTQKLNHLRYIKIKQEISKYKGDLYDCLWAYVKEELMEPQLPGEIPELNQCFQKFGEDTSNSSRYIEIDIDNYNNTEWDQARDIIKTFNISTSSKSLKADSIRRGKKGGMSKNSVVYSSIS